MPPSRKQRLKAARVWFKAHDFSDDDHILSAYRRQFNVDRVCAMRELLLLGVLTPEKQKSYKEQLAARDRKFAQKRERKAARKTATESVDESWQDEDFFFIAGCTPAGAPYGITWEEEAEIEATVDKDIPSVADFELPFS